MWRAGHSRGARPGRDASRPEAAPSGTAGKCRRCGACRAALHIKRQAVRLRPAQAPFIDNVDPRGCAGSLPVRHPSPRCKSGSMRNGLRNRRDMHSGVRRNDDDDRVRLPPPPRPSPPAGEGSASRHWLLPIPHSLLPSPYSPPPTPVNHVTTMPQSYPQPPTNRDEHDPCGRRRPSTGR